MMAGMSAPGLLAAACSSPPWPPHPPPLSRPGCLPRRLRTVHIAPGPFQPTWESLKAGYKTPEWFRDAKFGIWTHWTAQCVPEQGDWYARRMYLQGDKDYDHHLEDLRPSLQGRLDGDRQSLEGRELEAGRADGPLRRRRREILHRARQPPRQLRQLQLPLSTTGTRSTSARRRTSSASTPKSPARMACASPSPTTRRTPGTGCRPPTPTTPKARSPASATTPTASPRPTAKENGGRASTRRSSTPAATW